MIIISVEVPRCRLRAVRAGRANLIWTRAKLLHTSDLEFFDTCEFVVSERFHHFLHTGRGMELSILFCRIHDTLNSCGLLWVSMSIARICFRVSPWQCSVSRTIDCRHSYSCYVSLHVRCRPFVVYIIIGCVTWRAFIFLKCEWMEGLLSRTRDWRADLICLEICLCEITVIQATSSGLRTKLSLRGEL